MHMPKHLFLVQAFLFLNLSICSGLVCQGRAILIFEIWIFILGLCQGTAIKDRIQERLMGQQLRGLIYDEEFDVFYDDSDEDKEEEEEDYYDNEDEK